MDESLDGADHSASSTCMAEISPLVEYDRRWEGRAVAATLDDVKGFFRTHYVPKNAVVTIVGDFEPEATLAMVEEYFGHLPPGERTPMPEVSLPAAKKEHMVEKDDVKLPRIYLAWHTPALYAPGDAEMDVLASVLSDGKTSRLYKPLVYDKKVAKDVSAFQVSRALGSMFVVQATVAPGGTIDELAKELDAALKAALASPPSEDEMLRAINGWRKSFYGRVESVLARAQLLSTYFHLTGKADYVAEDLARYTKLKSADIADAAKGYIHLDKPLRIDIVPEGK